MQTLKTLGLAAALTALAASGAFAQTNTQSVTLSGAPADPAFPSDNSGTTAQIGTSGPSSSTKYMDVEGVGNGSSASFGVVDIFSNTIADPNGNTGTVTSVAPSITFDLTDQPFSHTTPGSLNFYLADGTAALSSLQYDPTDTSATAGVGSQLGNLYSLGQGVYSSTSRTPNGGDLPFTLNLNSAAQSVFLQRINTNGGDLRFVITADPTTPNEVGSFDGIADGGKDGGYPSVSFTVTGAAPAAVPEASTTVSMGLLLALGLGGLAVARRRKVQA